MVSQVALGHSGGGGIPVGCWLGGHGFGQPVGLGKLLATGVGCQPLLDDRHEGAIGQFEIEPQDLVVVSGLDHLEHAGRTRLTPEDNSNGGARRQRVFLVEQDFGPVNREVERRDVCFVRLCTRADEASRCPKDLPVDLDGGTCNNPAFSHTYLVGAQNDCC